MSNKNVTITIPYPGEAVMKVKQGVGKMLLWFGNVLVGKKEPAPVAEVVYAKAFMTIKVVGVTFEGRQDMIKKLNGNEDVHLVHMPEPKFPNRIRVMIGGMHVGHIPDKKGASVAANILSEMADGYELVMDKFHKTGGLYTDSKVGLKIFIVLRKPFV